MLVEPAEETLEEWEEELKSFKNDIGRERETAINQAGLFYDIRQDLANVIAVLINIIDDLSLFDISEILQGTYKRITGNIFEISDVDRENVGNSRTKIDNYKCGRNTISVSCRIIKEYVQAKTTLLSLQQRLKSFRLIVAGEISYQNDIDTMIKQIDELKIEEFSEDSQVEIN